MPSGITADTGTVTRAATSIMCAGSCRRASICSADTVAYDLRCPPGRPLGLAVGNDTARPCRANTSAGDGTTTDWLVDAEDDDDDDDADREPDEAEECASRNSAEPL